MTRSRVGASSDAYGSRMASSPPAEALELPHPDVAGRAVEPPAFAPRAVDAVLAHQAPESVTSRPLQPHEARVPVASERLDPVANVHDEPGVPSRGPGAGARRLEDHDPGTRLVLRQVTRRGEAGESGADDDRIRAALARQAARRRRRGQEPMPSARRVVGREGASVDGLRHGAGIIPTAGSLSPRHASW